MTDLTQQSIRINRIFFVLDYASFGVGTSFLAATTVLPNLVRELGGSAVAVGALAAIMNGCWFLPQIFAGRYSVNKPLVKTHAVVPALIGRLSLILAMPLLLIFGRQAPAVALVCFLLAFAGFWIGDAVSAPGWFELVGKAIPLGQRSRVMGIGQTASSLAALGVGAAVAAILGLPNRFPINYVILLGLANVGFVVSVLTIAMVREAPGSGQAEERMPWKDYLPKLAAIMRNDAPFRRLTVIRWLAGIADMAMGFYILFAGDRLGIRAEFTGALITAGVVGSLLAGIVLGPIGDRRGSGLIVKIIMALRVVTPVPALLAALLFGMHTWIVPALMVMVFVVMGLTRGADFIGFMAYLLEIVPAGSRSLYIGLANTLGGVTILAPLVAGWLVEVTSYEFLFVLVLGASLLGLMVAMRIPQGKHVEPSPLAPGSQGSK